LSNFIQQVLDFNTEAEDFFNREYPTFLSEERDTRPVLLDNKSFKITYSFYIDPHEKDINEFEQELEMNFVAFIEKDTTRHIDVSVYANVDDWRNVSLHIALTRKDCHS
jgi:hypothetical protein